MEEISDNEIEEEKIEKPSKRVLSEKQLEILKKGREVARMKRDQKKELVKPELVRAESPEEPEPVLEPKKRGRKPKAKESEPEPLLARLDEPKVETKKRVKKVVVPEPVVVGSKKKVKKVVPEPVPEPVPELKKRGRKPKALEPEPEPVKVVEQKPRSQRKEKIPRQTAQPVVQPLQVQIPMVRPLRFV